MKVENPRPGVTAPLQADAISSGRPTPKETATVGSDTVQLSGDLRLADKAIKAAGSQPDVRPDAVARGRALLESGDLGSDVTGLADRMLDAMTDPHDSENP